MLGLIKKETKNLFSVNFTNENGDTPLHEACALGNLEIVESLLAYKSDINAKNGKALTPIQMAVQNGHFKVFNLLHTKGASLTVLDGNKNSLLHLAVLSNNEELVRYLIKKRLSATEKNQEGLTPIDLAQSTKLKALLKETQEKTNTKKEKKKKSTETDNFMKNLPRTQNFLNAKGKANLTKEVSKKTNDKVQEKKVSVNVTDSEDLKSTTASKTPKKMPATETMFQDSDSEDLPEDIINPTQEKIGPSSFNVLTMIGKGSFGEVFLVEKKDTKLLYAMKVLNKSKIKAHNLIRYASTERNVLSVSDHPFIVGLRFAFQTHEYLFMILDFCPGGDLSEHIAREGKFSEPLAKLYLCEIILALEDLHSRDIIFRDLKPDNVVLDKEGHALLTDFGLSKEGIETGVNTGSFCGL